MADRSRAARILVDLGVPALVLVAVALGTPAPDAGERPPDLLAAVCVALAVAALALHHRHPRVTVAVVSVALAVHAARSYPGGPFLVVGPLALLGHGLARPRRESWLAAGGLTTAVALGRLVSGAPALQSRDLLVMGWVLAATAAADALRGRVERATAARRLAADARARAVTAERLRIAQDLHDSVTHAMVSINVQAGVARHLAATRPTDLPAVLESIRTTSAAALDELTVMVQVLRDEPDLTAHAAGRGADDRARATLGLETVPALVRRAREAGLAVDLAVSGTPAVPARVETAAYRVVQEALTNTLRHAPGATVRVSLDAQGPGRLEVGVEDDGLAVPSSTPGLGLVGMRERVTATGGTLDVGPAGPDAPGFSVRARWPA